ncbi:hypothetical protein Tco_0551958 [Tanacetum coccineum]
MMRAISNPSLDGSSSFYLIAKVEIQYLQCAFLSYCPVNVKSRSTSFRNPYGVGLDPRMKSFRIEYPLCTTRWCQIEDVHQLFPSGRLNGCSCSLRLGLE